ncbi:hydroxymethylbilane synthase [Guggenheimella bovis]
MKKIIIATRGSKLALKQAHIVQDILGVESELLIVHTKGDKDQTSSLRHIGGNGLFVREIEEALLSGKADIAVHSAKDLPYALHSTLTIGAVAPAWDARDVLISKVEMPRSIATDSPRRRASLKKLFPEVAFESLRGNIETRLQKLRDGDFEGIVLAKAGLDRLDIDLREFFVRVLDVEECIPAPNQGIIAIEARKNDREVLELLKEKNDLQTWNRFEIERKVFERLEADCSMAVGVHAEIEGPLLTLHALLGDREERMEGTFEERIALCEKLLEALL